MAGRLCYLSYGKGRKTNREFVGHLIEVGHGSVLEHCVWSFVITGVSRSLTHELVRHRAGWAYSQLSQRYVDESESPYVEPDVIAEDPALHAIWTEAVNGARAAYDRLVEGLERRYAAEPDATLRRKLARQAARSVLPNATETRIFVTANARALRHFIEMRGSAAADVEIREVALQILGADAPRGPVPVRRLRAGAPARRRARSSAPPTRRSERRRPGSPRSPRDGRPREGVGLPKSPTGAGCARPGRTPPHVERRIGR